MSETITQLREHIDERFDRLDKRLDRSDTMLLGDGISVEGLVPRTKKNEHDIGNVKTALVGIRETQELHREAIEKVENKTLNHEKFISARTNREKWITRVTVGSAIAAIVGSLVTGGLAMATAVASAKAESVKGSK